MGSDAHQGYRCSSLEGNLIRDGVSPLCIDGNLLRKRSLSSQQALVTAPNPISHPKGLHLAAHLENNARKITAHDKGLR
jgi:hypothetical protein